MKTRSARWFLGLALWIGTLTAAEAAGPLTQVGTWMSLGAPAHDLVIRDNLAYVVTDKGLKIVDLTDPAAPAFRGAIDNLGIRGLGIALVWPHVYVANQSKDLQIIDVSNPDAPRLVKSKLLPGNAWDVALKDERGTPGGRLIAYVASFGGEVYVVDVTDPNNPLQIRAIGLPAWASAGGDAGGLAKLNAHVTSGSGKVTGIAVVGDRLAVVEWAYGRLYLYDVSDGLRPGFAGTHYAPFLLRVKLDPAVTTAYAFAAYGTVSGVYSVPLSILGPSFSTRHESCADCSYVSSPRTDYGGLNITASGKYVMAIGGKYGEVQVVDVVTDPTDMREVASVPIPFHYAGTAQSMGVAQYGDYVIAAAARLGLGVFRFPGLSDE